MSWRTLTETDLLTAISPDELALLRRALGGQADDAIARTLTNLANELRGYISAGGSALDATTATLPDSVIAQAAAIACIRIASRAGGALPDPKGLRKLSHDNAIVFFQTRVAEGKFSIEQPTATSSETLSSKPATPAYTAKTLTLQREDQSGV